MNDIELLAWLHTQKEIAQADINRQVEHNNPINPQKVKYFIGKKNAFDQVIEEIIDE